jgi:hypothetical protein
VRGLASHYATGSEERRSPPKRFGQQARPPCAGSKSGRRPKLTTAAGCSFVPDLCAPIGETHGVKRLDPCEVGMRTWVGETTAHWSGHSKYSDWRR